MDDISAFEADLTDTAWLSRMGRPHADDSSVARIFDMDRWPGPEDAGVLRLALWSQDLLDRWVEESGDPEAVSGIFGQVHDLVRNMALTATGQRDVGGDAWHGSTQACWDVGWCAGLIAVHLSFELDAPSALAERWTWFRAGHWPYGFADDDGERLAVL